ncbi:dynamin family protein [Campylobacter geochelonis]|uniref:dynamin family protein n=1 Tax=Campylobacter geochelonis TaxID=1780362 RepID=UPI000770B54C|nr:dynamin family protein [Campylobacter geochelonis]CZE50868.1 GTP-binding protein [Campylobacter geochelonis]
MDEFLTQIWGINKLYLDLTKSLQLDSKSSAIVLSCSEKNYDRYISLESFCEIFKSLNLKTDLFDIQTAQVGVINAISHLQISRSEVLVHLKTLSKNEIISDDEFENITKFINSLKLIDDESQTKIEDISVGDIFHHNINVLNEAYFKLKELNLNPNLDKKLDLAYQSALNSQFYLSVTGVINAGKSTMLNALLDLKLLGTSNIPETANLTLLKFSQNQSAKVHFWSEDELKTLGIEENAPAKNIIEIKPEELKTYTTAKNEISKFVKLVELGANAEFLKDNICIVDTPGLDDAVVLREELTKKFMHESDFNIHLMNAAQSATKKDMEFIKNFLKYGKSGGFVVVLTHIDALSQKELNDVIIYTKRSIASELESSGFSSNLINSVEFFMVDSLNRVGIDKLKNYLYEKFFGKNSLKAQMILSGYKKELNFVIKALKDEFEFELSALGGSKFELENELDILKKENLNLKNGLERFKFELKTAFLKLDYSNLEAFSSIKTISTIIKDRVINDVVYANKNKKKLDFERIFMIVQGGFNDLILDVFRELKFLVSKDIEALSETLALEFEAFNKIEVGGFDIKAYLDENLLKVDYTTLQARLLKLIQNERNLAHLPSQVQELFDEFLKAIDIKSSLVLLANDCTSEFKTLLENGALTYENELKNKIKTLEENANKSEQNSQQMSQKSQTIREKLETISQVSKRISQC